MGIENRPYVGTWRLNNRKVVKHTPDALVYINGDLSVPGCPTCGGRIDLQKYITQVSVDPSTEGPATASITLHIPRHAGDPLFHDGNSIIRPGLEVHVYMRGYFPTKGLLSNTTPAQTGGVDVRNAALYPYYMVFHGVTTEVSHEYSGGEHTATISCADMLHFWQYQRMATSGSAFGARPTNSKVKMSLVGHTMTGMSPYAIIYQLYRDVQGSAGGVEFALGNKTNASANSTVVGESLFSLSILYWEKRFSQTVMSLRMFGADGTLYNAFQAAFLASLSSKDPETIAKKYAGKNAQSYENDPLIRASRAAGFNPFSVGLGASGSSGKEGQLGINVAQLQAFASDISQWGNVNLWETQYVTKLEVANNVKEACGFEFYQDVDGDLVFKPPFYNLDTSGSRVYRIEDIDIISLSTTEREPEATVVKATGGHFQNMKGFGLENNEWGTRAEFIDYRAVAQYGWRQQTFETTYHTNPQAMFFACVARYDIFNIGVKGASCTIPIRPELRPGYPVYIPSLDCFYYIHSMNHSLSFGGQCTTTLNLVGRRAKFFAPGEPPLSGQRATIDNIKLNNMHLPPLPLEVMGNEGLPRFQGFPNVVMTIDPELVNPLQFAAGVPIDDLDTEDEIRNLIAQARSARLSPLQQDETGAEGGTTDEKSRAFDGPFRIQTGPDTYMSLPTVSVLLAQAKKLKAAYASKDPTAAISAIQGETQGIQALVSVVQDVHRRLFPTADSSATYLELLSDQKAAYSPGASLPGYYRYYSSSHPDAEMQGPKSLEVNPTTRVVSTGSTTRPDSSVDQTATQFVRSTEGLNELRENQPVLAGIPLIQSGTGRIVSTPTHQIKTFAIAQFQTERNGSKTVMVGRRPNGYPAGPLSTAYAEYLSQSFGQVQAGLDSPVAMFSPAFAVLASVIETHTGVSPTLPYMGNTLADISGDGVPGKIMTLAKDAGATAAKEAARQMLSRQKALDAGSPVSDTDTDQTLGQAWAAIWPEAFNVQAGGSRKRKSKVKTHTESHSVPVLPVSDERGYEVVGTYAYGRGLRLDTLSALSGFDPAEDVDYEQVEEFLRSVRSGTDYSQAIGSLDPAAKALLASGTLSQDVRDILAADNPGGTVLDNEGRNWSASTHESTQKVSVVNAAYSLADLSVNTNNRGVCSCKGADADVLLQAFNTDLFVTPAVVSPAETEEVQDWLQDQMVAASIDWAATQSAYRGAVLDVSSTGLFDAVSNYPNILPRRGEN